MNRLVWLATLVIPFCLKAQDVEFGISGGISTYFGDISPSEISDMVGAASPVLGFRFNTDSRALLHLQFNFHHTNFSANHLSRKLNFQSRLEEVTLSLGINPLRLLLGRPTKVYPYVALGYGIFYFNPKGMLDGQLHELQPLGTEGQGIPGNAEAYRLLQPVVPVRGGLKIHLSDKVSLTGEISYHHLFTDYLDDISSNRVNYLLLLDNNGPIAARLSNPDIDPAEPQDINFRRGGQNNDFYYFANLILSYRPGVGGGAAQRRGGSKVRNRRVKCPVLE